jgi:tetratricopeptide (TPR) repeat protein
MKKIAFLLTLMFVVSMGFAQNSKVVTAYNYQRNGKLEKAKEAIDEAVQHEKTMADAKAWYYRGNIYLDMALSADSNIRTLVPDPLGVAYDSYKKAIEYDEKEKYREDIDRFMEEIAKGYYNIGVLNYNASDYSEAASSFENTYKVYKELGKIDTVALFNAAVSANLASEYERSLDYYKSVMELDYENPEIYISMGELNKALGDTVAALEALKMGRERFPENFDILISETNIYLAQNNVEQAIANLEAALEKEKNNPTIYFAVGTNYDQLGMFDKAKEAYKNAIALDPDYFEANYNLGALYVNKAAKLLDEANNLPLEDVEGYEKLKNQADDILKESLPYLEKAIELQPDDTNTLVSLKEIYTRLGMMEKLKVIDAKLGH